MTNKKENRTKYFYLLNYVNSWTNTIMFITFWLLLAEWFTLFFDYKNGANLNLLIWIWIVVGLLGFFNISQSKKQVYTIFKKMKYSSIISDIFTFNTLKSVFLEMFNNLTRKKKYKKGKMKIWNVQ